MYKFNRGNSTLLTAIACRQSINQLIAALMESDDINQIANHNSLHVLNPETNDGHT